MSGFAFEPTPAPKADALAWLKSHRAQGGVAVSSKDRRLYPEVSGYLVPTLLRRGEEDLALAFARAVLDAQRDDGSFADPAGREGYAFDTGQVLRGLVAILPRLPSAEDAIRRAVEWMIGASSAEGRLPVPKGAAWSLGARGSISEAVHLYALPGVLQASDALGERRWRVFVAKSMDYYARRVELANFARKDALTHLYAYVMEALIELGAAELAVVGMRAVAEAQHDSGLVPAYFDVAWTCTPGQFQSALVFAKLGERARAVRAFEFMRKFRNASGGYFGSYGPGADYFPAEEPSWVAKFEMDAEDALADARTTARPTPVRPTTPAAIARPTTTAAATTATTPSRRSTPNPAPNARTTPSRDVPSRRTTPSKAASPPTTTSSSSKTSAPTNMAPDQWHDAIVGGESPASVAARVRGGTAPRWLSPILDATREGDAVLEIGSGTGELSASLAARGRIVACLDFSGASLAFAKEVFSRVERDGTFVEADATKGLPFPDGAFDVAWSSGLLEHFEPKDQAAIVKESARVARRAVVALVPNARSLPYRLGKALKERAGTWEWGKEDPIATLKPTFEAAGLVDVRETTLAPEHAAEFLNGTEAEPFKATLVAWLRSLSETEANDLGQGYLLATIGFKAEPSKTTPTRVESAPKAAPRTTATPRAKRVLAIVPNDPLRAYVDAGYPDLTDYFNPGGTFDEVVCLSPHEPREGRLFGARIVPTRPADFARRCAEFGVSAIRAYDLPAAALIAPHRPAGVPFVVSVHDVDPSRAPAELPKADLWLPVSGACDEFLRERGADPSAIVPFSNRVDLSIFKPIHDPIRRGAFEARFRGGRRILHVGRHARQKNQDGLVEALTRLPSDYVAIFVGKGDVAATKALALSRGVLDRCHFVDAVDNAELAAFYSFSDVFCVPSRWEGFGVVFVEAAACGAPIVSTNRAPMNEFLRDEATALLVGDPENPEAIAAAIRRAVEDPIVRGVLKARAREAALPFSKEAVDAREIAAYRTVLKDDATPTPPAARATIAPAPTSTQKRAAAPTPRVPSPNPPPRGAAAPFEVALLSPETADEWNRVVRASPDAWLYHTLEEQVLLATAWKGEAFSFVLRRDGRTVGVVPLQRWPWDRKILWSTLMGPAGPALAGDLDPEARDEALEFAHGVVANLLLETKATTARMILPPLAPRARETWNDAENPLLRYGYADDSTLTSVVDLRGSEEAIFGSFCRAYRNRIRKAEKDGVVVEPIADRSEIDVYYALHVETYERTGVKPHPKAYFEAIYDLMASRGLCEILFAKRDGRAIAAINVATFGDASLYWTGANGAAGLELGAAKLLHWTAMKRAKARGVVLYETGEVFPEAASGTKHAGLTDFKGRFGGAVVPFRKGVMAAGAAARTRR